MPDLIIKDLHVNVEGKEILKGIDLVVRAHDRVHFPTADDEIDPLEDLLALYAHVEVFDDKIRQRSLSPS